MQHVIWLISAGLGALFGISLLVLLLVSGLSAQAVSTPQATCEQQLDEARANLLQLRKQLAQSQFQAAAVEEIAVSCQKKASEQDAKSKAVQAGPPAKPTEKK